MTPIMRNVVAEAGRLPMRDVVPADHVHCRGVHPGESGHLQDHPAGPGRSVDDALARRHSAVGERLDAGRKRSQPVEERVPGITPLQREVIARRPRLVQEGLPQLVAEDGFADRRLRASLRELGAAGDAGATGQRPRLRGLAAPGMEIRIVSGWHREASS
jgi:hypothetical protein